MKTEKMHTLAFPFLCLFVMTSLKLFQATDGPHGGIVKEAGDYNIEMRNQYDHFYVFLLDDNLIPINNSGLSCDVRFYYADSTSTQLNLIKYEEDGFRSLSTIPVFTACKIFFHIQGKIVSAKFDNSTYLVKDK